MTKRVQTRSCETADGEDDRNVDEDNVAALENQAKRLKLENNALLSDYVRACCVKVCGKDAVATYERLIKSNMHSKHSHFITWFARLAESLYPSKLNDKPNGEHLERFKQLACNSERSRTPLYMSKLKKLGLNSAYLAAVEKNYTAEEEALFREWDQSLPESAADDWKHLYGKARIKHFMLMLDHLYKTSWTRNLSKCGRISLEAAANHCRRVKVGVFHHLLALTGFEHSLLSLQQSLGNSELLRSKYARLSKTERNFTKYLMLRRILGRDPYLAAHMSAGHISKRFLSCHGAQLCSEFGIRPQAGIVVQLFKLLSSELEVQGASEMLRSLRSSLPYTISGENTWTRLELASEWMSQLLQKIEQNFQNEGTTGVNLHKFKERTRGIISREIMFLDDFAERRIEADDGAVYSESEPLEMFLTTCTIDEIEEATLAYMRAGALRNDTVKSAISPHHASKRCSEMIRLWKIGLQHIVPTEKTTHLVVNKLLKKIENKREIADDQSRRYYTDSEIEKMFGACLNDAKMTLVLTILTEVGLRNGALNILQFYSLVDERHEPRHTCNVREKAGSRRVFITSERLQAAIRIFYEQLLERLPRDTDLSKVYIFNEQDPSRPLSHNTLRCWLSTIAKAVGITDVHVHPHSFRHTLVCKLMDAGNSLEAVSKYMGHKSVSTTNTHYWVSTMQDLHNRITNPASDKFREKAVEDQVKDAEIELLQQKKQLLLQILADIEDVLRVHANDRVQDAVGDIHSLYPDLPRVIDLVKRPEV